MDWTVIERLKTEDAMTKAALYQAPMGNTGQNHNTSLHRKHQDQEDKLRSVVSNFNNISVSFCLKSICSFFD
jgi:hypothetical protein